MKKALVIGLDHYPDRPLNACVADANAIGNLLKTDYDNTPNWAVERLVTRPGQSPIIDREVLASRLAVFFGQARRTDLLLYFAGHALASPWGVELATQTGLKPATGVSLHDIVALINASNADSITVVMDCCFSGDLANNTRTRTGGLFEQFQNDQATLREDLTILTASRGDGPAVEGREHGAFTELLLDGLNGGASDHRGRITALSLFSYISAAFSTLDQQPQLKTNSVHLPLLRRSAPWIELDLLRALPHHFPQEASRIRLTPAHEGLGRPLGSGEGTPLQQQFDYLGRLRDANLVSSDSKRPFYWLAMEEGEVYLTPLGRYFWRLARKGAV